MTKGDGIRPPELVVEGDDDGIGDSGEVLFIRARLLEYFNPHALQRLKFYNEIVLRFRAFWTVSPFRGIYFTTLGAYLVKVIRRTFC